MLRTLSVLLLLALTGCSGSDPAPAPTSTSSPSPSASSTTPSATPTPVPPAPKAAGCYRLGTGELTRSSNRSRPVPCSREHNARTIFVGRVSRRTIATSVTVQEQLARTCPAKLAGYVGGQPATRDLSRLNVVWFSPTQTQVNLGARWFRCDLIAFSRGSQLLDLPRRGSLRGVLSRPGGLDTYGLCGTAAPGAAGFDRVVCARRHSWRAFGTVALPGGRSYPGSVSVRTSGDAVCKGRARDRAADTLRFRYGWEWPTRAQWQAGQHFGYCWMPTT